MNNMPSGESPAIRRTIYFSGQVQGVGFRYSTRATASRFRVTGYVRNLPDGRVELVAEASQAELDRYQAAILDAMHGYVRDVAIEEGTATGEFPSFTITR